MCGRFTLRTSTNELRHGPCCPAVSLPACSGEAWEFGRKPGKTDLILATPARRAIPAEGRTSADISIVIAG